MRVRSGAGGRVSVEVSADFGPLKDFLESDIGSDLGFLRDRMCGRQTEPWGFGSDSCHVTVGDEVLVENDCTGQQVVLSRGEFVRVLEEYRAVCPQHG